MVNNTHTIPTVMSAKVLHHQMKQSCYKASDIGKKMLRECTQRMNMLFSMGEMSEKTDARMPPQTKALPCRVQWREQQHDGNVI